MPNQIFKNLLEYEIEKFKSNFSNVSRSLFYDQEKKRLIHPGEYGIYRERSLTPFLRMIMPQRLNINSGFLITPKDNVSTQCDIVIYDSKSTPLIEDGENQTFYPIETVVGIGEVKSTLSKADFEDAVNKLAKNKQLRKDIIDLHPPRIKKDHDGPIDLKSYMYDSIFSFLICEKLNFNFSNIDFDEVYDPSIEQENKHNLILSLKDGIFLYYKEKMWGFPIFPENGKLNNSYFLKPKSSNSNEHIHSFANFFHMGMQSGTIFYPEMAFYLN